MANFWGAATEGFNQGLSEALKRAAEKRQRDFMVQQQADARKYAEGVAALQREQDLADQARMRDITDPITQWTPSPYQDPIAAMLNPNSLGAAQRRSDVEFANKQTLLDAQLRSLEKNLAVPDGPSGSVLVPGGKWPGYYEDPNNPGQAWVPGSEVDNATTPRGGRGWGGGSPTNDLVDVPLSAIDPQYAGLFQGLADDNGNVPVLRGQMTKFVIPTKPQVSTDEDAAAALRYSRGGLDDSGNWKDGIIPEVIDKKMTGDQWAAFDAKFTDTYKATGSQQQALNAAYSTIDMKSFFPSLAKAGTALVWDRSWGREKSYGASEFETFYKEFAKEEKLSRGIAEKLWSDYFAAPAPAAEQPKQPPAPAAPTSVKGYLLSEGLIS